MIAHEQRDASAKIPEAMESERRRWVSPSVRVLSTSDAALTARTGPDGGASFS
jgi:hypothetical protein